jgi:hypothetical protein
LVEKTVNKGLVGRTCRRWGIIFKVDVKRGINGSVCTVFFHFSDGIKWELCDFNGESSVSENIEKFLNKLGDCQFLANFDERN